MLPVEQSQLLCYLITRLPIYPHSIRLAIMVNLSFDLLTKHTTYNYGRPPSFPHFIDKLEKIFIWRVD